MGAFQVQLAAVCSKSLRFSSLALPSDSLKLRNLHNLWHFCNFWRDSDFRAAITFQVSSFPGLKSCRAVTRFIRPGRLFLQQRENRRLAKSSGQLRIASPRALRLETNPMPRPASTERITASTLLSSMETWICVSKSCFRNCASTVRRMAD